MLLLALDTSTSAVTAALHDGTTVVAEATTLDSRGAGERLAPAIQQCLRRARVRPADLTHVVCGLGPGPFTGLRVGIVSARVLALTTGAALHGVCSLDALAAAAPAGEVLVATDARRREIYWGRYVVQPRRFEDWAARIEVVSGPAVGRAGDLPEEVRQLPTVGRGALLYPELLPKGKPPLDVSSGALAALAVARLQAGDPLPAGEPIYLRRPDATPQHSQKSTSR